jgi:hypothetical protein
MQHIQWLNEKSRKNKINAVKVSTSLQSELREFSDDLKHQLGCLLDRDEELVEDQGGITTDCLLDLPISNYELMFEYSSDYLLVCNRHEQLMVMEQLCFNFCSYSELTDWLIRYEAILRLFENQ